MFSVAASAQTLVVTNGVQIYTALTNTTVTMSNRCELRLTATNNPIPGCTINLNSSNAWLVIPNIRPSVSAGYLSQVFVNGAAAVAGGNCRVDEYVMGTIIIPQSPSFAPLQIFSGPNFTGASTNLGLYNYYATTALGALNGNIHSFKLKRGYMATFAQNADGTGASKVFIAQDGDLEIGLLETSLNVPLTFVRVFPWRWTAKRGWDDTAGMSGEGAFVNPHWFYDWGNGGSSTSEAEYAPMKWSGGSGTTSINTKQNSTHVLGYNEPDSCSQSDSSVADAIADWPNLMKWGMRAGAPAVSDSGTTGTGLDWLYNFMSQATNNGWRVDFIPIHFYKCAWSSSQLSNYLAGVFQITGKPIWLTEFNYGANWCSDTPTPALEASEITSFISVLESAPFVERYSVYNWVGTNRAMVLDTSGTMTPAGVIYRDTPTTIAYTQTLPAGGSRSLAQFHFEGDVDDSSGFGNNGFAVGIPTFTAGHNGQAVALDGTNSFIRLPPNVANSADFTFAAWIYWSGGASWQRIFDFGDDTSHYLFLTPNSGNGTLRFAINNGSGEQIVQTAAALPAGGWQHVAVTLTGGTAKIYTNGLLAASGAVTIVPSNFNPNLNYLGKSQFSADPLFHGSLDEVQIADYAFTAAQIAALQTDSPPQFATNFIAGGSAMPGAAYNSSVAGAATDPDAGDTLTYSKASGPAWLSVAANGTLSGTPGIADVGTNYFTVRATDAAGASAFAVVAISLPTNSSAGTWSASADGNWSDPSKWSGGVPANGAGNTADFSTVGASHTVTLDNSRSIGTLKFSANWNLTASGGSALTLDAGSAASPAIVVNQNTATLSAPLAGANGFTKSGAGTLVLATNNPLGGVVNVDSGSTTASDGIVRAANAAALAKVTTIRFRNNSGASAASTLQLDGTAGSITANADIAINGRNASVATIENVAGTNFLTGTVSLNVGGANYWIQSDAGLLAFSGNFSPVATSGTRTLTFQGGGDAAVSGVVMDGCATVALTKSGAGKLTLSANNNYSGGTTVSGGTLILAAGGSSGAIVNNLTINPGATVNLTATDALGYTNGGSGVTFVTTANVSGTLNNGVNGNNGFDTIFNLTGGTMSSTGGGAYNLDGATSASINSLASATVSTVSANLVLRSVGVVFSTAQGSVPGGIDLNISGAISGAYPIIKSGPGTLSLSGANTYTGATTISAGTLLIGGAGRLNNGAYSASITNNGAFNYNSSQAQILSGVISGTGALAQNGSSTLTLSAADSYSGNTTVNSGALALGAGGSIPNTPNISVAGGATLNVSTSFTLGGGQTLKGSGTILGNLIIAGTLAPGSNSIGVLTCNNNVTFQSTATNIFEINKTSSTNDQLKISGALTYGGTLRVTNLSGTLTAGDAFKLFSAASYAGSFSQFSLPPLGANLAWNTNALTNGILSLIATARPQFGAFAQTGDGNFQFSGAGAAGVTYELDGATNLSLPIFWIFVTNAVADQNGFFQLWDLSATNFPQRFYRISSSQ
jgi:autotransporter-associated beta strand protein